MLPLLPLACLGCIASGINFTDGAVAPIPAAQYERYVTFLAVGTRTYSCDPTKNAFSLDSLDYDLFDGEMPRDESAGPLGKHILLLNRDAEGGNSVFYTRAGVFTYWVGRTMFFAENPGEPDPIDLPLEQALRTEASSPKPLEAGKYDMGAATYATRFGAVGGNVPADTPCTPKLEIPSTTYYSLWKKVA